MNTRASQAVNSIPRVQQAITLYSLHPIKTYQRLFRVLESNLYLSSVLVRLHGARTPRYAAQIRQVEDLIGELLQEVQDGLSTRDQALAAQLAAARLRPEDLEITYRNPLQDVVEMRTPRAVQLLAVFRRLDRLCRNLDVAWFGGLMATEAYLAQCTQATRQITTLAGRIGLLARGVARCVLGEGEAGGAYTAFLHKRRGAGTEPVIEAAAEPERDTAETLALVERVEALAPDRAPAGSAEGAGEESAGEAVPVSVPAPQTPEAHAGEEVPDPAPPFPLEESAGGAKPGLLRTVFGQGGRAG